MSLDAPARSSAAGAQPASGRRWPWVLVAVVGVVLAALVLVVLTAKPTRRAVPPPGVTPSSAAPADNPPVTEVPDPTKPVVDAYLAFEQAFDRASEIPDPGWPALTETATGDMHRRAVEQLEAWKAAGRAARYPTPLDSRVRTPVVVSLDATTAVLRVCDVDDGQLVDTRTGRVVNSNVVTRLSRVTLVLDGGRWKVSDITAEQRWEGVAGCAA